MRLKLLHECADYACSPLLRVSEVNFRFELTNACRRPQGGVSLNVYRYRMCLRRRRVHGEVNRTKATECDGDSSEDRAVVCVCVCAFVPEAIVR